MIPAEINNLIAERVMGWEYTESFDPYHDERDCMRALEKMREKGWNITWESTPDHPEVVQLWKYTDAPFTTDPVDGTGPTFCAAACEAMRRAVEEDQ